MTEPTDNNRNELRRRMDSRYDKLNTVNDFLAALFFLIGSIMFFYNSLQAAAAGLFTAGSVNFMFRPTIKLVRQYHLARIPRR